MNPKVSLLTDNESEGQVSQSRGSAFMRPVLRLTEHFGHKKERATDLMNESDDSLMVRVKRGDHQAFRILADRYRACVARLSTGSSSEVASEVLMFGCFWGMPR